MSLFESASLVVTPNGTKASKLYAIKPTDGSGDLSVVRATTATRVNSEGLIESVATNVPRLDYTNGSCPSILVEPQRTNLVLRSEEFENSAWTKNNTNVTANSIISPDGTQNADKITPNNTNTQHFVLQNLTATNTISYTYSVFAKKGEIDILQFSPSISYLTTQGYANFNLTSGTVTASGGGVTASIINFGNNWYKCILTFTANATGTGGFALFMQNSPTATRGASYLGDGTSSLCLWGAQLEAGSYATSYIKSVASSVTRNAETFTNSGDVNTFNDSEGVLFAEIKGLSLSDTSSRRIGITKDGTSTGLRIQLGNGNISATLYDGSSNQYSKGVTIDNSIFHKIAFKYKENDFALWIDGIEYEPQSFGSTFADCTLDDLSFDYNNSSKFYGNIKQIQYFPNALTDSELQQLTTI